MTRLATALPILALSLTVPLAAPAQAQAERDFQLPPAPTPTADNRVQGPVDTDAIIPVRPRAIETARPAEQTPAPTPTTAPTGAATVTLPATAPARQSATPRATSDTAPDATATATAAPPTFASSPTSPAIGTGATLPATIPSQAAVPATSVPKSEVTVSQPFPWWQIALGGLVAAAGLALLWWRGRRSDAVVPVIAVPQVPVAAPGDTLAIGVEAVRLDRSVLNATVGYRVTLRNRTAQALEGVAVEADLVSASRDRPAEQQLASPGLALTPRHAVGRLAPGQSLRIEGQVRLPLAEASAIWQGQVGLLVPLLRVRATAATGAPVATTLVIGRAEGSTARPQPFRLDEPPRSYAPLAQRVLDGAPARA